MQALPLSPWDYGDRQGQSSFLLCCISKILFSVNLKGQKKKEGGCESFTSLIRKLLSSYQPRNAEWALGKQNRPGLDCSVPQSCPTLCNPMDVAAQASLSFTISWSLLKLMSIESVMPSNHLIFYRPLLLLPSMFPSIRVFSNESTLSIR